LIFQSNEVAHKSTVAVFPLIGVLPVHAFHEIGSVWPFMNVWLRSVRPPSGIFQTLACIDTGKTADAKIDTARRKQKKDSFMFGH